jgi:hypothetical protein
MEKREQNFVKPTIGYPGPVGGGSRENPGVGKGMVLKDPVANFQVQPKIIIGNAVFRK